MAWRKITTEVNISETDAGPVDFMLDNYNLSPNLYQYLLRIASASFARADMAVLTHTKRVTPYMLLAARPIEHREEEKLIRYRSLLGVSADDLNWLH